MKQYILCPSIRAKISKCTLSLFLSLNYILVFDWFIIIHSRSNEQKCILSRPGNDSHKLLAYRKILEHLMLYLFVHIVTRQS